MKRLLIANLIIGTFISVQANAATQIDNAPHGNPLALFSTKDMGGNVKRATYGVKWKDGAMTYTNIELVCGENKARDIGYSDDGTGTVWKDRSNDLYNGKKHYDLVKDSIQSNVYRSVCKDAVVVEDKKKKDFESERYVRGMMLVSAIKKSAFDPDAIKMSSPKYFSNGVCVEANGKNRFGAYVGAKDYCWLVDKKGVWTLHE
jgi:hypothetical protein